MTNVVGARGRVLFLVAEADALDLAEDLSRKRFSQAGVDVVIATAAGKPLSVRLEELSDGEIVRFACVFVPDHVGALAFLAGNADAGRVLRILHGRNAPIVSVGHGPAVLLSAPPNSEGQWLFDGYRLTSYAGDEMPWRLDIALKAAGAVFEHTQDVVVDRNLVTARDADAAVGAALELMAAKDTDETPSVNLWNRHLRET
jgi:putative intracellular protease/amidase